MKAGIREIFCSAQGEGPYVGVRQAFVRFEGCNLNCDYCDTQEAKKTRKKCMVEVTPGKRDFMQVENPVDNEKMEGVIEKYAKVHSVSLTGGEPLLHANFIKALEVNAPLFLETNMTLPEKAEKVKSNIKYVAGDFKLRDAFKGSDNYEEIREDTIKCYRILRSKGDRDCFCKVVIKGGTDVEEILENVEHVKDYISCLILQPLTPVGRAMGKPLINGILDLQESVADIINDVRIIPQTHKLWGAL